MTPRFASAPSNASVRLGKSFGSRMTPDLHELLRVVQALVGMKERSHRASLLLFHRAPMRKRQRPALSGKWRRQPKTDARS